MEHFRSPIFVLQTNENADEQKISEKYAYLDWNPWRGGGGIFSSLFPLCSRVCSVFPCFLFVCLWGNHLRIITQTVYVCLSVLKKFGEKGKVNDQFDGTH